MSKRTRQAEILQLIAQQDISTQAEMAAALGDVGIEVAQATVSRDVAELGLIKVRGDGPQMIYATAGTPDGDRMRTLSRALRRWASTIRSSSNLVLITTPAGYADPLAQVIDEAGHADVVGTIAGDNTVLVVADDRVSGAALASDLLMLSESQLQGSS